MDGGTYNGQTIAAIGLTKAAHIYWRAQSVYQTPTTKFADHADALEASCADLIGVNLNGLSTGAPAGPSGQMISTADCVEVSDMIAAVEFRTDPTQCNFGPALNPNTPRLCGPGQKNPSTHYVEDFEDGLAGWTLTNTGTYSGWADAPTDWAQDTSLPGGRAGAAAFAAGPDEGDCGAGANDITGVMRLESPAISVPAAAVLLPRITFDHYFATEPAFDGGNVKISINGGAFEIIPASAFTSTPTTARSPRRPPREHQPAAGPARLHGHGRRRGPRQLGDVPDQPGGGRRRARRHHQAPVRLRPGRLRRRDGWYVDNIKLQSCTRQEAAELTRVGRPSSPADHERPPASPGAVSIRGGGAVSFRSPQRASHPEVAHS